jgi:hypothetical protein
MIKNIKFYNLLLEQNLEDVVQKYSQLKNLYDRGVLNKIQIPHVFWLVKQHEPPEDIIGLIPAFQQNKQRLSKKHLHQYDSNSLTMELESLQQSKAKAKRMSLKGVADKSNKDSVTTEETTNIGQFGPWIVVMPHTTESSCYWANKGGQVSWCTARTVSRNMFLDYTAFHGAILYYVINTSNELQENNKLCLGFVNGKLNLSGKNGGITVNEKNIGLTEKDLKFILKEYYTPIVAHLIDHSSNLGQHPAKKELELLLQDINKFKNYISKFKEAQEVKDFLSKVVWHMSKLKVSDEIIIFILNFHNTKNGWPDENMKIYNYNEIFKNISTLKTMAESSHATPQIITQVFNAILQNSGYFNTMIFPNEYLDIIVSIIKNPNTSKNFLISLYQNYDLPKDILTLISAFMSKEKKWIDLNNPDRGLKWAEDNL